MCVFDVFLSKLPFDENNVIVVIYNKLLAISKNVSEILYVWGKFSIDWRLLGRNERMMICPCFHFVDDADLKSMLINCTPKQSNGHFGFGIKKSNNRIMSWDMEEMPHKTSRIDVS